MLSGLANFILVGRNHHEIAANLTASFNKVVAFREKYEPPFIAKVYLPDAKARAYAAKSGGRAKGYVRMVLTHDEWVESRRG